MNEPEAKPALPPGRSWRDIRQEVQPVAMSRRGRQRQILAWTKAIGISLLLAGVTGAVYYLAHSWATDRASLATAVHSERVREVVLITNGVLAQAWVSEVLALPKAISLMALDLPALRKRLMVHGQVQVAVLTRSFPDVLVVTLQERTPVARVQAQVGTTAPQQLLVAKDGVVYEGRNYDQQMLAGLPWLDGIRLVSSAEGFAPIAGMAEVSSLLSTVQLQAPHLYRGWLIVSLARLAVADEIVVRAQDIPEIIFTRKRPFFKQVAQLDYIIDRAHELPDPMLKSVNLTFDGQVPVRLENASPDASFKPSGKFLKPVDQRKGKREF